MSDARKKIKKSWALKFSPDYGIGLEGLAELFPGEDFQEGHSALLAFEWLENNAMDVVASEHFGVLQRNNQKVDQFILGLFDAAFRGLANPNDVLIRAGWSCIYDLCLRGDDHTTWFREATKNPLTTADAELIAVAFASYTKRCYGWSDPELIQMNIVSWLWDQAQERLLNDIEAGMTIDRILAYGDPAEIMLVRELELA